MFEVHGENFSFLSETLFNSVFSVVNYFHYGINFFITSSLTPV